MKKFLVLGITVLVGGNMATAQDSKKESKERHKNYWKKVGTDTRDFWKGEHERNVKKKEEREQKAGHADGKKERKGPPKPPNPFRKKTKQDIPDKEG